MSASPERSGGVRRGGRPGLVGPCRGHLLGSGEASAIARSAATTGWSWRPTARCAWTSAWPPRGSSPAGRRWPIAVDGHGVAGDEDMQILRQLAHSVALAVEALRSYAEEHLIALTLQRSFLPSALPAIPGLTMAFRYLPASDQAEVGGDFYEALPWQDGVLVAIGDVQGHSLHAATVMGELRHALRAFASEGHPPLAITGLRQRGAAALPPRPHRHLVPGAVRPRDRRPGIVNCGHMPVLLVDGPRATLRGRRAALMLGVSRHEPHTETALLPGRHGPAVHRRPGRGSPGHARRQPGEVARRRARGCRPDVEAFGNHLMSALRPERGRRRDDRAAQDRLEPRAALSWRLEYTGMRLPTPVSWSTRRTEPPGDTASRRRCRARRPARERALSRAPPRSHRRTSTSGPRSRRRTPGARAATSRL